MSEFSIAAKADNGWVAEGEGIVNIENCSDNKIIWREKGIWNQGQSEQGQSGQGPGGLEFSNIYRWAQTDSVEFLLEHLRYGDDRPVKLVTIRTAEKGLWKCVDPYRCGQDIYRLEVKVSPDELILYWQIKGPNKNHYSTISYR